MNKIEQQISRFKKLDIWEIVKTTIYENKEILIDLVTEQLNKGETRTGRTAEYTLYGGESPYAEAKAAIGTYDMSIFPYVNLYDEGDFQDKMDIIIHSEFIEILSNDEKASKLELEYTNEIYEPNEARMVVLKDHILPIVNQKIRNALGY